MKETSSGNRRWLILKCNSNKCVNSIRRRFRRLKSRNVLKTRSEQSASLKHNSNNHCKLLRLFTVLRAMNLPSARSKDSTKNLLLLSRILIVWHENWIFWGWRTNSWCRQSRWKEESNRLTNFTSLLPKHFRMNAFTIFLTWGLSFVWHVSWVNPTRLIWLLRTNSIKWWSKLSPSSNLLLNKTTSNPRS